MDGPNYDTVTEHCPTCEQDREHHVVLDIRTESDSYGGNQPYRTAECQVCGCTREERIGEGSETDVTDE